MIKVIFLDIDGVLNHRASLAEGIQLVNEKCKLIRRIVGETGAKIVISSTWRIIDTVITLNRMLHVCGGPYNAIIGRTPIEMGKSRGEEIELWLKDTEEKVSSYVIIDDDSDFLEHQEPFFFKTDMSTGLTTRDAVMIIEYLNMEDDVKETEYVSPSLDKLEKGDWIRVRDNADDDWEYARFSHAQEFENRVCTFLNGVEDCGVVEVWKQWRIQ